MPEANPSCNSSIGGCASPHDCGPKKFKYPDVAPPQPGNGKFLSPVPVPQQPPGLFPSPVPVPEGGDPGKHMSPVPVPQTDPDPGKFMSPVPVPRPPAGFLPVPQIHMTPVPVPRTYMTPVPVDQPQIHMTPVDADRTHMTPVDADRPPTQPTRPAGAMARPSTLRAANPWNAVDAICEWLCKRDYGDGPITGELNCRARCKKTAGTMSSGGDSDPAPAMPAVRRPVMARSPVTRASMAARGPASLAGPCPPGTVRMDGDCVVPSNRASMAVSNPAEPMALADLAAENQRGPGNVAGRMPNECTTTDQGYFCCRGSDGYWYCRKPGKTCSKDCGPFDIVDINGTCCHATTIVWRPGIDPQPQDGPRPIAAAPAKPAVRRPFVTPRPVLGAPVRFSR